MRLGSIGVWTLATLTVVGVLAAMADRRSGPHPHAPDAPVPGIYQGNAGGTWDAEEFLELDARGRWRHFLADGSTSEIAIPTLTSGTWRHEGRSLTLEPDGEGEVRIGSWSPGRLILRLQFDGQGAAPWSSNATRAAQPGEASVFANEPLAAAVTWTWIGDAKALRQPRAHSARLLSQRSSR